jgi:hypothetical protein
MSRVLARLRNLPGTRLPYMCGIMSSSSTTLPLESPTLPVMVTHTLENNSNTSGGESNHALTEEEASRYDRQMRLWGLEAQQRCIIMSQLAPKLKTNADEMLGCEMPPFSSCGSKGLQPRPLKIWYSRV